MYCHPKAAGSRQASSTFCGNNQALQPLDLNLEVAARIDCGEPVTARGIPTDFPDPQSLITTDCIRPPT